KTNPQRLRAESPAQPASRPDISISQTPIPATPLSNQDGFIASLAQSAQPAGVHNGRGRPAPDRIGVYRNNVIVSLREALATTFIATRRLMGDAFFDAAAVAFAQDNKPASPLLFEYGGAFPDFLATLPGLADYPFVHEAARIEFARVCAYHAADQTPLAPDALAAVPPDALENVRFRPHPTVMLLSLPAGGLSAWQRNLDLEEVPAPAALITRPVMEVLVTPLTAPEYEFARALVSGQPLGQAALIDDLDLATALTRLLSQGAFQALDLPDRSS
ncbi:MAG: DNA-binding domain-containing protein, partial [Pseudomonadota bacterium]